MVKKHRNYVPQRRTRTAETVVTPPANESLANHLPDTGDGTAPIETLQHENPNYSKIFDLMEIKDGTPSKDPVDLPAILLRRTVHANNLGYGELYGSDDDDWKKYLSLVTAKSLIEALDGISQNYGFDFVNNPDAFSHMSALSKQLTATQVLQNTETYPYGSSSTAGEDVIWKAHVGSATIGIFMVFGANRRIARQVIASAPWHEDAVSKSMLEPTTDGKPLDMETINSTQDYARLMSERNTSIMKNASPNPARYRQRNAELLGQLTSPEMREFINSELNRHTQDWTAWSQEDSGDEEPYLLSTEGGQVLDYTILPKSEGVRKYVESLCEGLPEAERAYVDLDRLSVLESVRQIFGEDTTYFVHGRPRGSVLDESGNPINEAYIGLIIQYHDQNLQVTREDALVVSPIARKHAGYIVRHDSPQTAPKSWREVLASSKDRARALGARPLKFTNVAGTSKYVAFADKATEALTCPVEQFSSDYEFARGSDGMYRLVKRRITGIKDLQ